MIKSGRTEERHPARWRRPGTWPLFRVIAAWVLLALLLFTVLGWLWGSGGYLSWGRWLTNWRDVSDGATTSLDLVKVSLTTIGGIGGVGYLVIKYRERASAERAEIAAEREQAEQKLLSAVQQLGSESPQVRIAGVYSLADVADTYRGDYRQRVVDILCGYLRTKRGEWITTADVKNGDDTSSPTRVYVSDDGAVESTILNVMAHHLRKRRDATKSHPKGVVQEVRDEQLWCDCSIDLHGAVLTEKMNFQDATFGEDLNFESAIFTQEIDFENANFGHNTNFNDATFSQEATFKNSIFSQETSFIRATFILHVNFRKSKFYQRARFENAIFTQEACFNDATFARATYFDGAIFTHNAQFGGVTFDQDVHFKRTTFIRYADFQETQFQYVDFSNVTFSKDARFHKSKFGQQADFRSSTFKGNAYFQGSSFAQDAQFQYSTFKKMSQFQGSTFVKDAHFLESTFAQHAFFDDSTFNKKAIFCAATFAGEAIFHAAIFALDADFDEAIFIQDANFRLATFMQEAEPKEIIFPASMPLDRTTRLPYGARWAHFDEDGNILSLAAEDSPDTAAEGNEPDGGDPTEQ